MNSKLIASLLAVMTIGAADAWAQCGEKQCQGRCQYCVEGRCVPRRATYGHYQANWRRWPEPAPPVRPCPTKEEHRANHRRDQSHPDVELIDPTDEQDANPEFRYLQKRAKSKRRQPPKNTVPDDAMIPDNVLDAPVTPDAGDLPDEKESPFLDDLSSTGPMPAETPMQSQTPQATMPSAGFELSQAMPTTPTASPYPPSAAPSASPHDWNNNQFANNQFANNQFANNQSANNQSANNQSANNQFANNQFANNRPNQPSTSSDPVSSSSNPLRSGKPVMARPVIRPVQHRTNLPPAAPAYNSVSNSDNPLRR